MVLRTYMNTLFKQQYLLIQLHELSDVTQIISIKQI